MDSNFLIVFVCEEWHMDKKVDAAQARRMPPDEEDNTVSTAENWPTGVSRPGSCCLVFFLHAMVSVLNL